MICYKVCKHYLLTTFLIITLVFLLFSCGGNKLEISMDIPNGHVVDANKDGTIDDRDVVTLCNENDTYWKDKLLPYLKEAGMTDQTELLRSDANMRLMNALTVSEWGRFHENLVLYNKTESNIQATAKAIADKILEVPQLKSYTSKVLSSSYWGQIELANGVILKYAGIRYPAGKMSKYARISAMMSVSLVNGRLVRYELTGGVTGSVPEAYVFVDKICINEELVKRGYALADESDIEHWDKYSELELSAKRLKRGLWAFYPEFNPEGEPLY